MVIFGADQEDHDANLINLLNVCQKEGLVLNSKKLELRRERVTFFGAEYSAEGMHPDPKKVQGITEMTALTDKQQLQSFLGMVNYMGTFIPNLSHHTEPLRAMLKKRQRVSLGRSTNTVLSASQDLNCQSKHDTVEILRQGSAGNSSSGRFSQRAGSLSHTEAQRKGPADCLCQQEPHGHGDEVCQHRMGTSSHCLCLPKV